MFLKDDENGRVQSIVHTAVLKAISVVRFTRKLKVSSFSWNVIANQNSNYNRGLGVGLRVATRMGVTAFPAK